MSLTFNTNTKARYLYINVHDFHSKVNKPRLVSLKSETETNILKH